MMVLLLTACLADIRPSEIDPAAEQAERAEEGRALLAAAAEAHGGIARWRALQTTELLFRDDWYGMAQAFNPWPSASIRAHVVQKTATFDSRVRFLSGEEAGLLWGLEQGSAYTAVGDDPPVPSDDGDIRFMLPTTQYFLDLPFRIPEAEHVRSVGERTVGGETFDVVYATWGSIAANGDFDQYLLFLDQQTHRIDKVQYTVREIAPFVGGTCHLMDQRQIDGLWIPHEMVVTASPDEDPSGGGMHRMVVEAIRHGTVDPDSWELREGVEPLVP